MNAIKLPVKPAKRLGGWMWELIDGDGTTICNTGASEQLAREIATDINRRNSHDALVEALKFYARTPKDMQNRLNWSIPATMNDWTNEIRNDAGDIARAALAKVEELRKTQ